MSLPHHLFHLSKPKQPRKGLIHFAAHTDVCTAKPAPMAMPFSSPGQQESNLTSTFTSMFAIRVTFIFVTLCETQVFGLQWSREHKAVSLSRHLQSTPAMLRKSQDRQGKDFQQGRKSILESNRGIGIYGSLIKFHPSPCIILMGVKRYQ